MDSQKMKKYSIVVIGAGAGGLVVAIGAAKAGKKVLLIEKGHWGGDCTNFGCIPSKTLIASAEAAHHAKEPLISGAEALKRVRETVKEIRSHEEPEALEKLGVDTLTGTAAFISPNEVKVGEELIQGDRFVIATGSAPFIPPIEGLKDTPYLTNETIFDLEEIPKSLGVLGAGPIGCELAQAFQRLGSKVTIIKSKRGLLPNGDPEAQEVMEEIFKKEGLQVLLRCDTHPIDYLNGKFRLCTATGDEHSQSEVDALLVATGRRPQVSLLDLEKAGVTHSEKGITVDAYGRTNQKHIFAIGDAVGGLLFTHLAENQGRAVLTTLLMPGPLKKKFDPQPVPNCTYTSPEVAQVGMLEKEALEKFSPKKIAVYRVPLSAVDRAITQGKTEGFVKVVTKKWSSEILGATIVAPRAGEMLPELSLALVHKIPLRKLAGLIHPYPTYNAAIRKCADLWLTQTVLSLLGGKKK